MSDRVLKSPEEIHPAPGFNHIAIAPVGRIVCLAGQVALSPSFELIGGDDLTTQTTAAMGNVEIALKAAGASWEDVVRRTVYTTAPTEYEAITAGIEAVTGDAPHPPQTIVGVTGLAVPGLLVEIEVTAVLGS
ncbi:MAG: RidA family protein [Actinobacteria bacterium]|nr:RidA family protein [Actinomycetota bacterium]